MNTFQYRLIYQIKTRYYYPIINFPVKGHLEALQSRNRHNSRCDKERCHGLGGQQEPHLRLIKVETTTPH